MEETKSLPFNWIVPDNSKLPRNIRTISAEKMDADTLRNALALMCFPVNVVEIRVPIHEGYKTRFKDFLTRHAFEADILPEMGGVKKTPENILNDLTAYFAKTVDYFYGSAADLQTLKETRDLILGMHKAFSEACSSDAASGVRVWAAGNTDISDDNMIGFHTHSAENINLENWPGFYLNFTGSDIGTMFKDHAGDVWVGEGWSYFLFPTSGHHTRANKVEAADHGYPSYKYGFEDQKRATFISQMFLPPICLDMS